MEPCGRYTGQFCRIHFVEFNKFDRVKKGDTRSNLIEFDKFDRVEKNDDTRDQI